MQYACNDRVVLVTALIYVDRVLIRNPLFSVTEVNVHRLLLSCVVSAIKALEDEFYTNGHYAKVGGLPLEELNKLEITLLYMLQFELFVTPHQYEQYNAALSAAESTFFRFQFATDISSYQDYCSLGQSNYAAVPRETSQWAAEPSCESVAPTS